MRRLLYDTKLPTLTTNKQAAALEQNECTAQQKAAPVAAAGAPGSLFAPEPHAFPSPGWAPVPVVSGAAPSHGGGVVCVPRPASHLAQTGRASYSSLPQPLTV